MDDNYRDTIISLRQEALARQQRQLVEQAQSMAESVRADEEAAARALAEGDKDGALLHAEWANQTQTELNETLSKLPPPQPDISDAKQRWIEQRLDLVGNPQAADVAGKAHRYVTVHMGVTDDSPEYFECLGHLLEPPNYQPMPTPDDVVETLRKTSKYGADLKPSEYNKQVNRLWQAKKMGAYPDKQ